MSKLVSLPVAVCAGLLMAAAAAADVDSRQILLPVADVDADAGWTVFSGESFALSLQDLTQDISFTDRAETSVLGRGPTGSRFTVRLKSGAPPRGARDGDHIIHVWARAVQSDVAIYRVELLQGEQRIWFSDPLAAGGSFTEVTATVPQLNAFQITDYQDLRLRFYSVGGALLMSKTYMEVGEDQAPDLGFPDTELFDDERIVTQFEVDPLFTGVIWMENTITADGRGDFDVYCSTLDQETGRPVPVGDQPGVFMGKGRNDRSPQIGRTSNGPVAVLLDAQGYIVTCDINEEDPALSVVKVWSGPDLDPSDDDPVERDQRSSIFLTKDFTQPDRIVVYQIRDPEEAPGFSLAIVNLDDDPLTHLRLADGPPRPPERTDALVLSTQRTIDGTPIWLWGCFPSDERGTPLGVCRTDISTWPNFEVEQVIQRPESVLYGWGFIGADGLERWIAGYNPPETPIGAGSPNLRMYVEAEPQWVLEAEYTIDTELWGPSFVTAARGQTPEVVGPDALGRYFVTWSFHDTEDSPGPFAIGAYGKLVVAEIGKPNSGVVVSRKQNHQVQTEPEPFLLNGEYKVVYSETRSGPIRLPSEGDLEARILDMKDWPRPPRTSAEEEK